MANTTACKQCQPVMWSDQHNAIDMTWLTQCHHPDEAISHRQGFPATAVSYRGFQGFRDYLSSLYGKTLETLNSNNINDNNNQYLYRAILYLVLNSLHCTYISTPEPPSLHTHTHTHTHKLASQDPKYQCPKKKIKSLTPPHNPPLPTSLPLLPPPNCPITPLSFPHTSLHT